MLQAVIQRNTSLIWCFTGCRCNRHINNTKPCDIKVELQYEKQTENDIKLKKKKKKKTNNYLWN